MKTITPSQRVTLLQWWARICAEKGWQATDRAFRLHTLGRWLGRPLQSLNEVGRMQEFDTLKSECLAILQPADIKTQMELQNADLIRLRWSIRRLADQPYWSKIARDKFGTDKLDTLNEEQLTQLRNTLARAKSRKGRVRGRAYHLGNRSMPKHEEQGTKNDAPSTTNPF